MTPTPIDAQTLLAQKPRWAQAFIVAELHQNRSNSFSDYHGSTTVRHVALAWSATPRENFREMRQAAARFEETKHLTNSGREDEKRHKHSLGRGYFLCKGLGYDGWVVSKEPIDRHTLNKLTESVLSNDAGKIDAATASATATEAEGDGWSMSPGHKEGYVELRFDEKPDEQIRSELKRHGFRWARSNACWFGRQSSLPQRYRVPAQTGPNATPAAVAPTESAIQVATAADESRRPIVTGMPITDAARAFYVTAVLGPDCQYLLGPYNTEPQAQANVERARRYANANFSAESTAFTSYGTGGYTGESPYPSGILNVKIGLVAPAVPEPQPLEPTPAPIATTTTVVEQTLFDLAS